MIYRFAMVENQDVRREYVVEADSLDEAIDKANAGDTESERTVEVLSEVIDRTILWEI